MQPTEEASQRVKLLQTDIENPQPRSEINDVRLRITKIKTISLLELVNAIDEDVLTIRRRMDYMQKEQNIVLGVLFVNQLILLTILGIFLWNAYQGRNVTDR